MRPPAVRGSSPLDATPTELAVIAVIELADRRNCAVVAQRQAVLRNAAALLARTRALRRLRGTSAQRLRV